MNDNFYDNIASLLFSGLGKDELLMELMKFLVKKYSLIGGAIYIYSKEANEFYRYRQYKRAEGKGDFADKVHLNIGGTMHVIHDSNITFFLLKVDNEIIGLFSVLDLITDDKVLENFVYTAHLFGLILKRTFLYSVSDKRKILELTPLYEITKDITVALEPMRLLKFVIKALKDVIKFDLCMVFLKDETGKIMKLAVSEGLTGENIQTQVNIDEDPVIKQVVNENKAILVTNVAKQEMTVDYFSPKVNSFIAVPLSVGEEILGTINFAITAEVGYTEEDVRLINIISSQIAALLKISIALSELQVHSQNILRSITTGVVTLNKDREVTIKNDALYRILDISHDSIIAFLKKVNIWDKVAVVLDKGNTFDGIKVEYKVNDKILYLLIDLSPLYSKDQKSEGVIITVDDITHSVMLENEMNRNEKLTALGQLSAGVAHEIRNPLTAIRGFTQLLPIKYNDPVFRDKFINIMLNETQRLNEIVEQLLDFTKPQYPHISANYLNKTFDGLLMLIKTMAQKQNIIIDAKIPTNIRFFYDKNRIEQALINILLNAVQVMPDGGKLFISVEHIDDKVVIKIRDTGKGMTSYEVVNMFNPFFTTKKNGTGLGLSITHKIITDHNGKITVDTAVNKGTVIKIELPYKTEQ